LNTPARRLLRDVCLRRVAAFEHACSSAAA
jgi:hypothetical protein